MRHLYVVIDMSQAMESQDLKPTRLLSALKVCARQLSNFEWNRVRQALSTVDICGSNVDICGPCGFYFGHVKKSDVM